MRHLLHRRCTNQVDDAARLRTELAEARAEILRLNLCLSRETAAANHAEHALAEHRGRIRRAHAELLAVNVKLRWEIQQLKRTPAGAR